MSRKTRFIDACYGRPTDCTPVWLMRQAGRYQASYQAIRAKMSFFELCQTPEVAAQVTVNAVEEIGVDAAIIFSDILVPLMAMGADVQMTDKGPKLKAIRDKAAIDALKVVDPAIEVAYVGEAIKLVNAGLNNEIPQIGFAGAPLTLASYLVEGGGSKSFPYLKGMLYSDRKAANLLFDKLSTVIAKHLRAQVEAGCHAIQLFDSWAHILSAKDYREYALPFVKRIFEELSDLDVPRIFFGQGSASLLEVFNESGADVISIDWTIGMDEARKRTKKPVQGNLDPCYLFMNEEDLGNEIKRVVDEAGDKPGHIFNLGHGILPQTNPDRARFLVKKVHELTAK